MGWELPGGERGLPSPTPGPGCDPAPGRHRAAPARCSCCKQPLQRLYFGCCRRASLTQWYLTKFLKLTAAACRISTGTSVDSSYTHQTDHV